MDQMKPKHKLDNDQFLCPEASGVPFLEKARTTMFCEELRAGQGCSKIKNCYAYSKQKDKEKLAKEADILIRQENIIVAPLKEVLPIKQDEDEEEDEETDA